jgi:hypothetical protein
MLILVFGLPGSGKTTLANAYAKKYECVRLNTDQVRISMGLLGHYAVKDKETVYNTVYDRTKQVLLQGKTALIDSTFYQTSLREKFIRLAEECNVPCVWIGVYCDENIIKTRVSTPRPDSEANFETYEKIRDAFEPFQYAHLKLRSDQQTIDQMIVLMHQFIQQHDARTS